jgi:hypothetical protein
MGVFEMGRERDEKQRKGFTVFRLKWKGNFKSWGLGTWAIFNWRLGLRALMGFFPIWRGLKGMTYGGETS